MTNKLDTGFVDFLNITQNTTNREENSSSERTIKTQQYEILYDDDYFDQYSNHNKSEEMSNYQSRTLQSKMTPGNLVALTIFFLLLLFLVMNGFDWLKRIQAKRRKHNCDTKKHECEVRHGNLVGRMIVESPEEEYERIAATAHRPEFIQQPDLQSRSARVCNAP